MRVSDKYARVKLSNKELVVLTHGANAPPVMRSPGLSGEMA